MIERKEFLDERYVKEIEENWSDFDQEHFELAVGEYFWLPWGGEWQTRLGEVMFLLPRPGGLLFHRKSFYPPDAWRLLTGGIKLAEPLVETLAREIKEEVGLSLPIRRYVGMITYNVSHETLSLPWITHVFVMDYSDEPLQPSIDDEIEATMVVPLDQIDQMADNLERLPHKWNDWGHYRAIGHRFVSKYVTAEDLAEF